MFRLFRARRMQDNPDGPEQDPEVVPERPVLAVLEVKVHPFAEAQGVAAIDLRKAGNARHALKAEVVQVGVLGDLVRELGPGADEAHVAPEHVDELGQLVYAGAAEKGANAGNARIVRQLEKGAVRPFVQVKEFALERFRVLDHGTELEKADFPAVYADAVAHVEHGAAVLQLDAQGDYREHGQEAHEGDRRHGDIEEALEAYHNEGVAVGAKAFDGRDGRKPFLPGPGARQVADVRNQVIAYAVLQAPGGALADRVGGGGRVVHADDELVYLARKEEVGQGLRDARRLGGEVAPELPGAILEEHLADEVLRVVHVLEQLLHRDAFVVAADEHDVLAEKAQVGEMNDPHVLDDVHGEIENDEHEVVLRRAGKGAGVGGEEPGVFQREEEGRADQKVAEDEAEREFEVVVIRAGIEVVPDEGKVQYAEREGKKHVLRVEIPDGQQVNHEQEAEKQEGMQYEYRAEFQARHLHRRIPCCFQVGMTVPQEQPEFKGTGVFSPFFLRTFAGFSPQIVVLQADDVVLAEVGAYLGLYDDKRLRPGAREAVYRAGGDLDFDGALEEDVLAVQGDGPLPVHAYPVFLAEPVLLEGDAVAGVDDEALYLDAVGIQEHGVRAPGPEGGGMHLQELGIGSLDGVHGFLDALAGAAPGYEEGVLGVDDGGVFHVDKDDLLVSAAYDEVILRVDKQGIGVAQDGIAPGGVPARLIQGVKASEVAPADVAGDYGHAA